MGAMGPAIFSDDLAADVRREYTSLLSIGKTDDDAEQLIINYYSFLLGKDEPDEAVFWFALALSEWNKGRLSNFVKAKALYYIEDGSDLARWDIPTEQNNYHRRAKVLDDLKAKLLSDQPARKKVKKAVIHRCPWREGALLAYRAVNCPQDDPLYNNYLLLRVVDVTRSSLSVIAPDDYFDERMIVAVYGWSGNDIPTPDIVKELEFVPTNFRSAFEMHDRYCQDLPYRTSSISTVDITLLAEDDGFDRNDYEFLRTDLCSIVISGGCAFELSQSYVFEKLGILQNSNVK